jgi:predicted nucleotidyltransferase
MFSFLGEIASAFAGIAGVEAVAWCGSTAMQKADSLSDYDLYVYWRTPVALEVRKKIIASRSSEYQLDNTFWELEDEWLEPEGLRFNVMYRSCREAEEEIHRRLVQHLVSLGYTTAYCFTVSQGNILVDPNSWLADLQRQTRETYPRGLLQAILRMNRPVLGGGMQSCYLKQIKAAIFRQDPVSLNHRVAAWLSSYFDILFAINGKFHPGEKRLLIYAEELAHRPKSVLLDVQQLCALAGRLETPIAAHLEHMLERLDETLRECPHISHSSGTSY